MMRAHIGKSSVKKSVVLSREYYLKLFPVCHTLFPLIFIFFNTVLFSQSIPAGINPSSLTPDQISSYENQARMQGYSQSDIDRAKTKYGVKGNETPTSTVVDENTNKQSENTENDTEESSEKTDNESVDVAKKRTAHTLKGLPYFGYEIFKNTPSAFKPSETGPVDPGYLVGPGDVLRLAVWGQVEFQHELTVSKEGKILVPVVGQVYVMGTPFEKLQEKLKNLLSRHYSGLTTEPQRTFMDLTVARLRPLRIFIMGEVRQPGGYTVSSFANVFSALYSVGGPTEKGSLREVYVYRNDALLATVDIYDYLLTGRSSTDVRLQNNDVVFVPPRGKTVAIDGPVFRPSIYELKKEDQLKKLLEYTGGITVTANVDRAQVRRVMPFDKRSPAKAVTQVIDININDYVNGTEDYELFDRDSISLVSVYFDLKNFVQLRGAVQYPGIYQCDSLTLKDLIFKYGKPVGGRVYMRRADLIRYNEDLFTTKIIPLNLEKLSTESSADMQLQPGDEIIVYEIDVVTATSIRVAVEGEVRNPGDFILDTNMTVADAILRAGSFTRRANRVIVDVFRPDSTSLEILSKRFTVTLPENLDYADVPGRDFKLHDRDRVVVRPNPQYRSGEYVTIQGLVRYEGVYALETRHDRLADVIERAGGTLPEAFLEGGSVIRNGQRVVSDFKTAIEKRHIRENIILTAGDLIIIPSKPNSIKVHGQVNNEGLFGYVQGRRLREYLNRAGGVADSAKFVLVTSPNGETRKYTRYPFHKNPRVVDGSEIYVTKKRYKLPEEKKGPSAADVIRDTLAIMASAVTIVLLVAQLR